MAGSSHEKIRCLFPLTSGSHENRRESGVTTGSRTPGSQTRELSSLFGFPLTPASGKSKYKKYVNM